MTLCSSGVILFLFILGLGVSLFIYLYYFIPKGQGRRSPKG